jgi:hypothetical protein
LSLLLFLQVQAWRTLQPMAVLAVACLALLSLELPKRGPSGLLGLAFLGAAWMFRDVGDIGLLAAPVGLLFVLLGDKMKFNRPVLFSSIAIGLLAVAAIGYGVLRGVALARALERMPEAWPFSQGFVASSDLPALVIASPSASGWPEAGRLRPSPRGSPGSPSSACWLCGFGTTAPPLSAIAMLGEIRP